MIAFDKKDGVYQTTENEADTYLTSAPATAYMRREQFKSIIIPPTLKVTMWVPEPEHKQFGRGVREKAAQ